MVERLKVSGRGRNELREEAVNAADWALHVWAKNRGDAGPRQRIIGSQCAITEKNQGGGDHVGFKGQLAARVRNHQLPTSAMFFFICDSFLAWCSPAQVEDPGGTTGHHKANRMSCLD